jgi:hypothetical protein
MLLLFVLFKEREGEGAMADDVDEEDDEKLDDEVGVVDV